MARCTPASSRPGMSGCVPALQGADGEDDRVVAFAQLLDGQVAGLAAADLTAGDEPGAFFPQLGEAPVQDGLLHLELGDAVAEQAAEPVVPFVHGDRVARPGELLGRRETGRAGADDRDLLAGGDGRRPRLDLAVVPGDVGDGLLDALDRDRAARVVRDGQHAGCLARGRAEAAGELGEVVGGVQPLPRVGQSPRRTKSFHSGIRLPSGQPAVPEWQNGMPQSMQRAAWVLTWRRRSSVSRSR